AEAPASGHPPRITGVEPVDRLPDPVGHDDLARALASRRGIDQPGPGDLEVGDDGTDLPRRPDPPRHPAHPRTPASRYSKAFRTATPFRTCSSISDRVPAATSGAISTPSLIGPGCMTSASGPAT